MLPTSTMNDVINTTQRNAKRQRQLLHRRSVVIRRSNRPNGISGQLHSAVTFSVRSIPSAFLVHVPHIVRECSREDVSRITARGIVASVKSIRLWPLTIGQKIRNTVCLLVASIGSETAVLLSGVSHERPACIRSTGLIDQGPEANWPMIHLTSTGAINSVMISHCIDESLTALRAGIFNTHRRVLSGGATTGAVTAAPGHFVDSILPRWLRQ